MTPDDALWSKRRAARRGAGENVSEMHRVHRSERESESE